MSQFFSRNQLKVAFLLCLSFKPRTLYDKSSSVFLVPIYDISILGLLQLNLHFSLEMQFFYGIGHHLG